MQRKLAKPKARKEAVSNDMIATLVDSLGAQPTLSDVGVGHCMLAFLCYDELAKLRCCDVTFSTTHLSVHITSSKTDQYRQGDSVVVTGTGWAHQPVLMLCSSGILLWHLHQSSQNCVSFLILWFQRVGIGFGHKVL